MNRLFRRGWIGCALMVAAMVVGGCSGYELKGRVIRGDVSWAGVVGEDDPRLAERGLPGVQIALVNDPMKINRERVSGAFSDGQGDFSLSVAEPGAGWMIYDVGVYASKSRYTDAEGFFRLPGKGKRLLIVLHPGRSDGRAGTVGSESLYEEADKNWR